MELKTDYVLTLKACFYAGTIKFISSLAVINLTLLVLVSFTLKYNKCSFNICKQTRGFED